MPLNFVFAMPLTLNVLLTVFSLPLQVRTIVKPGCPQDVLKAALSVMSSVTEVLTTMSQSSANNVA